MLQENHHTSVKYHIIEKSLQLYENMNLFIFESAWLLLKEQTDCFSHISVCHHKSQNVFKPTSCMCEVLLQLLSSCLHTESNMLMYNYVAAEYTFQGCSN